MSIYQDIVADCLAQPPLAYSVTELSNKYHRSYDQVKSAIYRYNKDPRNAKKIELRDERYKEPIAPTQETRRLKRKIPNTENVLVIGDLHEPFSLDGYLEFCLDLQKRYKTTHTIFIGDIIDNHFTSFHDTDADGYSARDELALAIGRVAKWVDNFPVADVCTGNHDRLIARKARSSGISALWLREYADVLGAPGWYFSDEFEYDNVRYIHGEAGSAVNRVRKDLTSTVQGHRHGEGYVHYVVGQKFKAFGMQVGCGIDNKTYAMAYAKAGPKPVIGAGVVLDHGRHAVVELMHL